MTKKELIEKLVELSKTGDQEINHGMADDLLLQYIDDEEVTNAFESIDKWYA